uniref:transmembrane protein 79 n=1 Tax=Gasterosteus aculeatus aculeatus TaxID=481459 RepID=UPI0000E3A068|nr:transmembrane protein 79 [Gasterosteus aculeatus aculeatus]XP_040022313.1 transmembrane protein 79 [Gasterosteus aculeatus aculeatus]
MSLLTEDAQCPTGSTKMQDSGGLEEEEGGVRSALVEPDTLQWPGSRPTGKGDQRRSASWTESERGLMAEGERRGGQRGEEGAEPGGNHLPEKAAQVFSPAVTVLHSPSSPRGSEALWEMESEKSPFLDSQGVAQDYNQHGYRYEWTEDTPPGTCGRGCPSRDILKVGVSLITSALFFPLLVWGGFVFLPFDAPLLDGAPPRLVYTLRCSVFAAAPIVLGWLVLGVSRLRSGELRPLFHDEGKEAELHEVTVHQRFVSDSASLFLIYFLQLVVMAMYLTQDQLKLIPLLTIVFALGRLVYWVAAAFSSSIRGFGFGLSFLPSLAMMAANFYFIFSVEASGSVFVLPSPAELLPTPPAGRQRFWG